MMPMFGIWPSATRCWRWRSAGAPARWTKAIAAPTTRSRTVATGKVEITASQNHGFVVDPDSLPEGVTATHLSLFDKTNEGLSIHGKPVFSVQHHPEASPGPQDAHYLVERYVKLMEGAK